MTYYEVLGVDIQTTDHELKAAYRRLAKCYHPDVVGDDPVKSQKMLEIQEAYRVLSDPDARERYNQRIQSASNTASSVYRAAARQSVHSERKQQTAVKPMSDFERFFGFQPGKGMETYRNRRRGR